MKKNMAPKTNSHDISTINNKTTFKGESLMNTNTTTNTTTANTEKKSKPEISVKDLKVKGIEIEIKKSCVVFKSAKGAKWYLKGNTTLEITANIPGYEDRIKAFTPQQKANCHLGNSYGTIKINSNEDLAEILKALSPLEKIQRKSAKKEEVKPVKKTAKKEEVKPVKKTAKKENKTQALALAA